MSGINVLCYKGGVSRIHTGSQGVTTSATPLPDIAIRSVTLKADNANAVDISIVPSYNLAATPFVLSPGDALDLDINNLNSIAVVADSTGSSIRWIAECF